MKRVIKYETFMNHYGVTVRDEKGNLDRFFPVFDDEGFETIPSEFIYFLKALNALGYKIEFD